MLSRFVRCESAAALVEFAIALPLLLLVLFGMISWGHSITLVDTMHDAARRAAREMASNSSSDVQARAIAEDRLDQWPANTFTIVIDDATGSSDRVRVLITSDNFFEFLRPIVPALPPLRAEVFMRKEVGGSPQTGA